jgi:hypothetical protein
MPYPRSNPLRGSSTGVPRYPSAPRPPNLTRIASQYVPGGRFGTNTTRYRPDLPGGVSVITPPGYTNPYGGPGEVGGGGGFAPIPERTRRLVTPDYSGILNRYKADAEARFGAGLAAMKAQTQSRARSLINRLGIRNVGQMRGQLEKYGLTEADLQGAADNPWSELKALDYQRRNAWANRIATLGAQGGFRSGATIDTQERLANQAARSEAELTQKALSDLSEGLFGQTDWERQQRDALEQQAAQYQSQLAAAYQPYWIEE